jgi:hypothetical protein
MTQADPKDLPGSPRARHSFKEPIRVEIDDEDFAERGRNNPIWRGYNIAKLLIDAGIPIWLGGGVASFKSVDHGRLAMWCEKRDGRLWRVYEWTPDAMTTGVVESPAVKPAAAPKPQVKKPAVVPFDEEEDEL